MEKNYNEEFVNNIEEKKNNDVYSLAKKFLKKYPFTITWRIKQHSKILQKHLNKDEDIIYLFPAQKNPNPFDIYSTCILALTSKRILISQKRVLWGYYLTSITPDLFNDFEVSKGLIFGNLTIDTVKEVIQLSDLDPRCLTEVETNISEYLLKIKREYKKDKERKDM